MATTIVVIIHDNEDGAELRDQVNRDMSKVVANQTAGAERESLIGTAEQNIADKNKQEVLAKDSSLASGIKQTIENEQNLLVSQVISCGN